VQKLLGPAWTDGGRLPTGHYTRRTADEALQTILADARRGTLAGMRPTGATFADAAAEYLRYVEEVRRIDAATASDYKGVVNGYLVPEFGQLPLESITPDTIDAYKERLIAEARLSSRVIVRPLTVMHGVFKRAKRVWGLERPASADLVERPQVVYSGEYDTLDRDELERLAGLRARGPGHGDLQGGRLHGSAAGRTPRAALARRGFRRGAPTRPRELTQSESVRNVSRTVSRTSRFDRHSAQRSATATAR
jgi:hypothetical protein